MDFEQFLQWYQANAFSLELLLSDERQHVRKAAHRSGLDISLADKVHDLFSAYHEEARGLDYQAFCIVCLSLLGVHEGNLPESKLQHFWREALWHSGGDEVDFESFLAWFAQHTPEPHMGRSGSMAATAEFLRSHFLSALKPHDYSASANQITAK